MESLFSEFALLLAISAALGAVAARLHQPLLVAYILVGILAGPVFFGWVQAHDQVSLLAEVGVTVLLFLVGLKLDVQRVRHIGPVALATGLGQLAFTILIGFGILLLLGKDLLTSLYVAVALTFSSTIIIVKLLSDKRELDSLHGRIAVGFLIVQDIAVVLAMMVVSTLGWSDADASVGAVLVGLTLRVVAAVVALAALMRWVLPWLVHRMAGSQELLLIFAIAWGTALAALGEWAGFSKEAGAFLAGFSLASTMYREALGARMSGVRDFLLLFFFIHLGAEFDLSTLGSEIVPAIVLSLFVLIGNPLIVMVIMGYMGYRKRTGFLAGLTVAQISEFSIVFVAMGIALGHVGREALGLTTLVGLVTITLSTYMILYSHALYDRLSPWLGRMERKHPFRELAVERSKKTASDPDVVVFGLGRYGSRLLEQLQRAKVDVLGVDFDPEQIAHLRRRGFAVRFGDGGDEHFLETLPLAQARWIVSALPDIDASIELIRALSQHEFGGRVAVVARDELRHEMLPKRAVDLVLYPFADAADFAAAELAASLRADEQRRPN